MTQIEKRPREFGLQNPSQNPPQRWGEGQKGAGGTCDAPDAATGIVGAFEGPGTGPTEGEGKPKASLTWDKKSGNWKRKKDIQYKIYKEKLFKKYKKSERKNQQRYSGPKKVT